MIADFRAQDILRRQFGIGPMTYKSLVRNAVEHVGLYEDGDGPTRDVPATIPDAESTLLCLVVLARSASDTVLSPDVWGLARASAEKAAVRLGLPESDCKRILSGATDTIEGIRAGNPLSGMF